MTGGGFIDLFAGCGGLSLGLLRAGWKGIFAAEHHPSAAKSFIDNLVDGPAGMWFDWPKEIPKGPLDVAALPSLYGTELKKLRGRAVLIAGGPPCQGFSVIGKRVEEDPRNSLAWRYLDVVRIL